MATFSNCLQIINAMSQRDQDALLSRLDELQAQGLSPKEAQLQAAIDVLAQVEREGGIRKSSGRLPAELQFPAYEEGAMGEGGFFRTERTAKREAEYEARGLVPVAAGGVGEIWVKPEEAKFIRDHGFGRTHLNQTALHAYQVAQAGLDPNLIREGFVDEMVNNLEQDAETANERFDELRDAAMKAAGNIRKSASRITDTAAFKRWFGDSKVVDENGKPLVVYHGSRYNADITKFSMSKSEQDASEKGIYFTDSAEHADQYSSQWGDAGPEDGGSIYPVYLKIENPYVSDAMSWNMGTDITPAQARRRGHDGYVIENHEGGTTYIVFKPEQIKSSIGNNGEFNPAEPSILKSVPRPQFYSQLQRAIEGVPDRLANMAAPAWKQWLTANAPKLGVKAEEVEWSGIKDYLDLQGKKKLSKDELSAYLDESGVKIAEVMLGGVKDFGAMTDAQLAAEYERIRGYKPESYGEPMSREEIIDELEGALDEDTASTKYGQYTLPGGENYRELLITLPASEKPATREQFSVFDESGELISQGMWPPSARTQAKLDANPGWRVERETVPDQNDASRKGLYQSSHWDEPNVLAHIRVNDRTDADGKRVLFVEEVQSDWGQHGRERGFKGKPTGENAEYQRLLKQFEDGTLPDDQYDRFYELQDNLGGGIEAEQQGSIPDAPFVTKTENWVNLALKRVAMMAVEGGYDKVAFVNGEQAAERFKLTNQIGYVSYLPRGEGKPGLFEAWDNNRKQIFANQLLPEQLEEYIGKEVAERLLATEPVFGKHTLEGLDLETGGEGMKTFYNQIVPQAVNKLLPKLGGEKLGTVNVNVDTATAGFNKSNSWIMDEQGDGLTSYRTQAEAERMLPGIQAMYPQKRLRVVTENPDSVSSSQPGFDVTDKMRETVGAGVPLFSRGRADAGPDRPWFEDLSKLKVTTNYQLGDLLKTSKKLSWWDRTVGTQYNLAQKHPEFKRVFDAVQTFINDVSAYATRAADMAQDILPKLETWRDIGKTPLSAADVKALRDPIFGGTLSYTRDEDGNIVETDDVQKAGVVFTDEELRSRFNLTDKQIDLYRQFRKATDQSITDLALSDMLRYLGEDGADIREQVMAAGNVDVATGIIKSHLEELAANDPRRAYQLGNITSDIEDKAEQANRLMDRGYAPLSRFGQYTVYAVGQDGEQIYFSMFENERDANKMAREMREQYPDATVTTGTMSQESYKLFSGVTPETLALFGEALGLEESGIDTKSEAYQTMLKVAKTNRSAMKRLIQRKGIDGFSEDAGRVLAGFVYSNARQISTNLHAGEIGRAASDVKDGDIKDQAVRLMEYIQNPQEEAQAIRGLLFTQFIGGSVASAMVNMTQPFTMTLPYLSQFGGATKAGKAMADAMKLISRGIRNDDDLKQALKRAEDEGVVSPQEVHQLMAQAQGKGQLQSGDGTRIGDALAKTNNFVAKLGLGWGRLFSAAEQFNRRITFIAAYKLAREQGIENPFAFAQKAIAESQGVYNKGNKPNWARGAVGGTLFTFKQYSIAYVEFLRRMWGNGPEGKKAVGLALAVLFMTAGLGGMPGADDLDDVIDGFAQRVLGKSFDSKQAKKEFFASILGQTGAEFVMGGLTGIPGAPIDLSGRMGLGNLIPGTGILTKKKDYGRDVSEVFGPAGTFFSNIAAAAGNVAQGEAGKAVENVSPVALQNMIKAADMWTMGMYRDQKGRKVIDVEGWEAAVKALGFQPGSVKRVQDATGTQQGLIAQNKLRETEIADKWAAGRVERDPAKVAEAQAELAEWNRKNPESPIRIDQAQINRRVQQAMMEKAKRLEKTAPKEIRQSVKQELERAN